MDWVTSLDGGESMRDCYQCGKCVSARPVQHVGSYGPRKLNAKILRGNNLIDDPDLWLCTTCGNCYRVCPKEVNPLKIMPAIREQAVLEGKIPDELSDAFRNLQKSGNPMGELPRKRIDWIAEAGVDVPIISQLGRPVDVLWYVSDYTSYHPRGKDAARAMARVMTALGVDFAILGPEERSDGDSADWPVRAACSSSWPSRTSRPSRSTSSSSSSSWIPTPTTRSRTTTRSWAGTARSSTTPSSSPRSWTS